MNLDRYRQATEAVVFQKNEEAINIFSELLDQTKEMSRSTMISILIQRGACYFRRKLYKEALVDLQKVVEMGYSIKENESIFFIYHQCSIQTCIDDAVKEFQEVQLRYGYNSSDRITYSEKINLDILTNKYAKNASLRYRGRSQSADSQKDENNKDYFV